MAKREKTVVGIGCAWDFGIHKSIYMRFYHISHVLNLRCSMPINYASLQFLLRQMTRDNETGPVLMHIFVAFMPLKRHTQEPKRTEFHYYYGFHWKCVNESVNERPCLSLACACVCILWNSCIFFERSVRDWIIALHIIFLFDDDLWN